MQSTGLEFPFAQIRFKTDGADILHDVEGPLGEIVSDRLISSNYSGQFIWRDMLASRLREFNYHDDGTVAKWKVAGEDKAIEIDPRIVFGAPQIEGVKTGILKIRFVRGDEVDELSEDYGISGAQVVEALLFEGLSSENPRINKWIN